MFLSNYELQNEDNLYENGNGKKILVNKYERNPQARKICIEKYGSICAICGFDASKIYGVEFKGKIEVHHIIPISEMNENYKINPEHDLIPLCALCKKCCLQNLIPGRWTDCRRQYTGEIV